MFHRSPAQRDRTTTCRRLSTTALVVGLLIAGTVLGNRADVASAAISGTIYIANRTTNTITEYPVSANGNVAPLRTISGVSTGLHAPQGLALDAFGTLYVANFTYSFRSITEYAYGASGNAAPIRTITDSTDFGNPQDVAVDAAGAVYVSNGGDPYSTILEFAAGATGSSVPLRIISGSGASNITGLLGTRGVAVDAAGIIYASNAAGANTVTEYSTAARGNVAPLRTINGASTGLNSPSHITVGIAGTLYVANTNSPYTITEYALGASGNASPTTTLTGLLTTLNSPADVTLGPPGGMFVTDGNNAITQYAANASGNIAPITRISGTNTNLSSPYGIQVTSKVPAPFTATATPPTVAHGTTSALGETGLIGATGMVTMVSGLVTLCTITLPATSCNAPTTLAVADYPISATYSGDSNHFASTAATDLVVTIAASVFTASATPASVAQGASSTLAESGLAGDATGTVAFATGTTALCTVTLPAATCAAPSSLAVGTYPVTATYSGDGNYAGSTAATSLTVTTAPASVATTTTVAPSSNPVNAGQPVTFTATVGPNPGGGTVTFSANGVVIGTCAAVAVNADTGRATCTTSFASSGRYVISAAFNGSAGFAGSTSPSGVAGLALTVAAATAVITPGTGADLGAAPLFGSSLVVIGLLVTLGACFARRRPDCGGR